MQIEQDELRLNALFNELAHKYGVEKAIEMFADATDIAKLIAGLKKEEVEVNG